MAILLTRVSQCRRRMQRVLWIVACFSGFACKMQDFAVNVEDILSDSLMPAALFVGQNVQPFQVIERNKSEDGSWRNAFSTMRFHRDKINEYKCSNFLTENLISEMFPSRILSKRTGVVAGNESLGMLKINPQGNMMRDEGSQGYSNWLEKSSTLEDIYDNYMKRDISLEPKRRFDRTFDKDNAEYEWETDYEEGDVTGYAVHNPPVTEVQDGDGMHTNMHYGQYSQPENHPMTYSMPYEQYYDTHVHPQATAGSMSSSFPYTYFTVSHSPISVEDFGKNFHLSTDFLNTNEILTAPGDSLPIH
ncbi:uncharacterized protein LOC132259202 [Phlebotomus argentipes]|uniref:uncharacterized protein LOC132259202 n=1 Tax=Phlebotomus argentipes TaxID=94469 RepID=UPI002892AD3F|nr:uncharacterized protein LOC132259202 [Phlebotomus argentipes]